MRQRFEYLRKMDVQRGGNVERSQPVGGEATHLGCERGRVCRPMQLGSGAVVDCGDHGYQCSGQNPMGSLKPSSCAVASAEAAGAATLVSVCSEPFALQPGDIIISGTPSGVGLARKPPVWMKAGDVCEVEIEGVGLLSNPVVDEG